MPRKEKFCNTCTPDQYFADLCGRCRVKSRMSARHQAPEGSKACSCCKIDQPLETSFRWQPEEGRWRSWCNACTDMHGRSERLKKQEALKAELVWGDNQIPAKPSIAQVAPKLLNFKLDKRPPRERKPRRAAAVSSS